MIVYMARSPERPAVRVERSLRERIAADEWASGEALPSVAALAAEYGVARQTVSRVLKRLEADGLIHIEPAWGTFRT